VFSDDDERLHVLPRKDDDSLTNSLWLEKVGDFKYSSHPSNLNGDLIYFCFMRIPFLFLILVSSVAENEMENLRSFILTPA
jgi:hypothetical protein